MAVLQMGAVESRFADIIWSNEPISSAELSKKERRAVIPGWIFPQIHLPSGLGKGDMCYAMEHERTYIKRGNHLWKPLGLLLLSVYWFSPIHRAAYVLMCKEIELA